MKFITKNSSHSTLHVDYKEKYIEETVSTKFLGSQIGRTILSKWFLCYVQHVMQLSWWSVSVTLTLSNQFLLCILWFCYKMWNNFGGVIFPTVGRFFSLEKKIIRIMAGAQPRTSSRSLFKWSEILPVPWHALMSFIINNQEVLQTTLFMHNINTWNRHHLHRPNATLFGFQTRYILCWHKNFQQFTTQCNSPQGWQGKIWSILKKIPTYTLLLLCRWICKIFVVFYTINLYICVFMTCSTFCCLYDKLTHPWNVCMYVLSWAGVWSWSLTFT